MRPRRLEVEGFTAFREPTVVDFDGADLFAFAGPTGSGKSSLVDALLFALYGVVPRYGDKRAVEPVISLGKNQARVRFDFSVGNEDFTAVRVVQRTKGGGATTAEARLEGGAGSVMGADEVTEAVETLLGLGYDHFTKCVVLPQGQFAAFLHDTAARRQELLRQLLDLGRYRRVRDRAVERQKIAETRIEVIGTQIDELSFATEDARLAAEQRRAGLAGLRDEIDKIEPELERLRLLVQESTASAETATARIEPLRTVGIPDNIDELASGKARKQKLLTEAESLAKKALDDRLAVEEAGASLPPATQLAGLTDAHTRLASESEARDELAAQVEAAAVESARAAQALGDEDEQMEIARLARERLQLGHAAHALAAHLVVGEPCPVCNHPVAEVPDVGAPEDLDRATAAVEAAAIRVKSAADLADGAARRQSALRSRSDDMAQRIADLERVVAGHPDAAETARLEAARGAHDEQLVAARAAEDEARSALEEARRQFQEASGAVDGARRRFDEERDTVAALGPPSPEREDLRRDWAALAEWAVAKAGDLAESAETAGKAAARGQAELAQHQQDILARLANLDLRAGDRPPRDVCVEALAASTQEVERIDAGRSRAADLKGQLKQQEEAAAVAKTLARHLAANGFEGWLMAEALETLVEGANRRLDDLSAGAFSLQLERREFRVVDHRNADERRSVKTLSGGETFLVSLALALSLADQLASMSVHGVARLESMFLDEGFGTLDAETLDVVATVIHELGSDGRTIGLITHVKDLAEQVPVRFEVRKGPGGATVERVDA
jgi:exonuclease SbcC